MRHFISVLLACLLPAAAWAEPVELLNVSYDPTREFYQEYNQLFVRQWKEKTGQEIIVRQSHGGSGKQARSVMQGLKADVVTLALATDIDAIAKHNNLIASDWRKRLPHDSVPFTSTVVFLVRKDNPKQILDWPDLVKDEVSVIMPNPKTSGGARWNWLAAWAYAQKTWPGDEAAAKNYMQQLLRHIPVLDTGARGATTSFAQRGLGDVLITWENEALLAEDVLGKGEFEIIYPSISIRAETPVAVVDKVVEQKNTRAAAEAYLHGLYAPEAQVLAAKHHLRPTLASENTLPSLPMVTVDALGGWPAMNAKHFAEGALFDQLSGAQ